MADSLGVDTVALHASAGAVDATADDFRLGHATAHTRMAAAQGGWIGASAAALAAKTAEWETDTDEHYADLVSRGHQMRSASAQYADTDATASSAVDAAASRLVGEMGL